MDIESRQIRHLVAIEQHGTITGAAKALEISQPSLTLSINRMEDVLKTILVQRGRNGAELTKAGRLLARRSIEIDSAMSSVLRDIELLSQGIHEKVRIGGTPLATQSIIPAVIARILAGNKNVNFEIFEGVNDELYELLDAGQIDVAISAGREIALNDAFAFTPLFEAKTVLAMRFDHPLAAHSSLSIDTLQDEVWALPPHGGAFQDQIDALFTINGWVFPKRIIRSASIGTLLRIVRQSDAITALCERFIPDELAARYLTCVEVDHLLAPRVFGILTKRNRRLSDLANIFCDETLDYVKQSSTF